MNKSEIITAEIRMHAALEIPGLWPRRLIPDDSAFGYGTRPGILF